VITFLDDVPTDDSLLSPVRRNTVLADNYVTGTVSATDSSDLDDDDSDLSADSVVAMGRDALPGFSANVLHLSQQPGF